MMRVSLILLAALAAASAPLAAKAPRQTEEQRLQKSLEGLVPGKPVSCVTQGPTIQSQTYDGAIVYRDGSTRYVNRFGGHCDVRANFDILIVKIYGSQLCRGDIARIAESGSPIERGSCVFDDFTPYTKAK